jgi:signal transduction histidine kinase
MIEKLSLGFSSDPGVRILIDISEGIGQFRTDPEMLEQILLNVITNSRQAVRDQGVIRISATSAGETLTITIEDNGPGIPEENMPRIFDPFFSTRDSGSGLGLAISKRLAGQLNGSLHVTSLPAQGTSVTLQLPYDRVTA